MSPVLITSLCTGIAGILTAAAGLVKSFRTQSNLTAHISDERHISGPDVPISDPGGRQ